MLHHLVEALQRKSLAVSRQFPRAVSRALASPESYGARPPIVLTTVPKSGTHLLDQACAALPGVVDWGSFLVVRSPPARYLAHWSQPRTEMVLAAKLRRLAPGELIKTHLPYSVSAASAIRARNAFIVFLVRDPRALVASTAHYLSDAAPWHALHRSFVNLEGGERLEAVIHGLPDRPDAFPDIGTRLRRQLPWRGSADLVLRYEDIRDPDSSALQLLVESYRQHAKGSWDPDTAVADVRRALDPAASHTFRCGHVDGWRDELSPRMVAEVEELAGDFLEAFGYR